MAKFKPGEWKIERSIGEGGQAHTYLASHPDKEVEFVVKRWKNARGRDRFRKEIEIIRKLRARGELGVPPIEDYCIDETATDAWYVIPFYPDGSLEKHGRELHRTPELALQTFVLICEAVARIHDEGVIHRDIKPANILVETCSDDQIRPVLADFGIAYAYLDESDRFTLTEERVGDRDYMAPELEGGFLDTVTPAVDCYSLGKLLWWMLCNRRPPPREDYLEERWDIGRIRNDRRYGFVNELLGLLLVKEPSKRLAAGQLAEQARELRRLLGSNFEPLQREGMRCRFCGRGKYKVIAWEDRDAHKVRNFGLSPAGAPRMRILLCQGCGHAELFRMDYVEDPAW